MMRIWNWLVLFALSFASMAGPQDKTGSPLEARAGDVVAVINEPKGFGELFSSDFRAAVSKAQFAQISEGLKTQFGRAVRVQKIVTKTPYSGQISVAFERAVVSMNLSVEQAPPHRINGLLITGTQSEASSFEAVQNELKALPGQSALSVSRLNGQTLVPLMAYHADRALAIGSSFKLYVLAELVRQIAAGQRH